MTVVLPEHPPDVGKVWRVNGRLDASSFRAAAQLVGTGKLFDPIAIGEQQLKETDDRGPRVFLRAPWYAIATKWLVLPTYSTAMLLWKCLVLIAGLSFALFWSQRWWAAAAVCWSLPFVSALEQGQDTPIMLLSVAGCVHLIKRNNDHAAGFILAFATIKPHLIAPVLFLLFFAKRWKVLSGFLMGATFLAGVSFWAEGWRWPIQYFAQLMEPGWYNGNTASPNINGLLPWLSNSTKLMISSIALLASLPALAWTTRHKGIEVGIWVALPIAVICSFHAYTQDILLSVPLALLAIGTGLAHSRISGVFLLSPVSTYALAAWIPMLGPAIAIASILWVAWTIRDLPDNNASLILSLEAESRD